MAKIEFDGFVNEQVGNPVFVLKVAENHRKKNANGEFENAGKTFFDVKVGRDSGVDLSSFPKDTRVKVSGRQLTEVREHNGKKYYTLTVWADSIEAAQAAQGGSNAGSHGQWASAPPAQENAPGGGFAGNDPWAETSPF